MTSVLVIGAAAALALVVALVHHNPGMHTYLIWCAAIGMLISIILQEVETFYGDLVLVDLARRLVFLSVQASVVSLVMIFRQYNPFSYRAYHRVWALAGVIGVVECVLVALMPSHADGTLYAYTEASRSPAVFAYYALYEVTVAATAIACSTGSIPVLLRPKEPVSSRISLVMMTVAAACTVVYVGAGWIALVSEPGFDYLGLRHLLSLVVVALLAGGLTLGFVGSYVYDRREEVMVRLGIEIVEPLWTRLTMLHPEVVLKVEPPFPMWRFLRLMIETHDAIHLIRYDTDPVIVNIINGRDPTDPRVTAELLVHLLGDSVIPAPPSWQARTMMRLRLLLPRDVFAYSLIELYRLHQALTTFYDPPNPPKDDTAYNY